MNLKEKIEKAELNKRIEELESNISAIKNVIKKHLPSVNLVFDDKTNQNKTNRIRADQISQVVGICVNLGFDIPAKWIAEHDELYEESYCLCKNQVKIFDTDGSVYCKNCEGFIEFCYAGLWIAKERNVED